MKKNPESFAGRSQDTPPTDSERDTKQQHTPGPWRAEKPSKVWQVNAPNSSVAVVIERSDLDITEANARLIAAAPELLDALKRVLPMARACKYEDFGDIHGNEDTRTAALQNALEAIAKAEGRS